MVINLNLFADNLLELQTVEISSGLDVEISASHIGLHICSSVAAVWIQIVSHPDSVPERYFENVNVEKSKRQQSMKNYSACGKELTNSVFSHYINQMLTPMGVDNTFPFLTNLLGKFWQKK